MTEPLEPTPGEETLTQEGVDQPIIAVSPQQETTEIAVQCDAPPIDRIRSRMRDDTKRGTIVQDGKKRVIKVNMSLPTAREWKDPARENIGQFMAPVSDMIFLEDGKSHFPTSTNCSPFGDGRRRNNDLLEHQWRREVGLEEKEPSDWDW